MCRPLLMQTSACLYIQRTCVSRTMLYEAFDLVLLPKDIRWKHLQPHNMVLHRICYIMDNVI